MSAAGAARLGLGTAQFGLDYGITNRGGRISEPEAAAILAAAQRAGTRLVDTAHLYGDSEEVLGRLLPAGAPVRIVTKTITAGPAASAAEAALRMVEALRRSTERLRRPPDALLFHDPSDLLGPFGEALWAAASERQAAGEVGKLGASVYEGAEADVLLDRFPLELVQIPWNPLDRRLADGGQLDRLRSAGVEVHARSLFLQGLLLEEPSRIGARFGALRAAVAELAAAAEGQDVSRLELLLALAFRERRIDRLVCGVTSVAEFEEIVLAANRAEILRDSISFKPSHSLDSRVLNPARWSKLH